MIKMQKTAGHAMQKSYYILVSKPFPTYIRDHQYAREAFSFYLYHIENCN